MGNIRENKAGSLRGNQAELLIVDDARYGMKDIRNKRHNTS